MTEEHQYQGQIRSKLMRWASGISRWIARVRHRPTLTRLSRHRFEFQEGGRRVIFYIEEKDAKDGKRTYSARARKWLPPFEHEEIEESTRRRIAQAVERMLDEWGY